MKFVFLTAFISTLYVSLGFSQDCVFNQPRARHAKLGGFEKMPQQGYVENFGGVIERVREQSARLSWGTCQKPTPEETFKLSEADKGSGYQLRGLTSASPLVNYSESQLAEMQEELIFLSAARNIYEFGTCQKGLFDSYFGSAQTRTEMLERSYTQYQRVRTDISAKLRGMAPLEEKVSIAQAANSCIKDSCAGRMNVGAVEALRDQGSIKQSLSRLEGELNLLIATIPMGNRDEMKKNLKQLFRSHPNVSKDQFVSVFDQVMNVMKGQVDATVSTFNTLKRTPHNEVYFCIDSRLKRQLYRSGQVTAINEKTGIKGPECRIGTRYGFAGEVISELLLIPTYFVGYGFARLALRMSLSGAEAVAAAGRVSASVSRMGLIGLQGADFALFAESAIDLCFNQSFLAGLRGQTCSPETEIATAYEEANVGVCLANIALYGATYGAAYVAVGRKAQPKKETLAILGEGGNSQSAAEVYKTFESKFKIVAERSVASSEDLESMLATYIQRQRKAGVPDKKIHRNIDEAFSHVCR